MFYVIQTQIFIFALNNDNGLGFKTSKFCFVLRQLSIRITHNPSNQSHVDIIARFCIIFVKRIISTMEYSIMTNKLLHARVYRIDELNGDVNKLW